MASMAKVRIVLTHNWSIGVPVSLIAGHLTLSLFLKLQLIPSFNSAEAATSLQWLEYKAAA
jgi:hypothetical protein